LTGEGSSSSRRRRRRRRRKRRRRRRSEIMLQMDLMVSGSLKMFVTFDLTWNSNIWF
jgi:hypothetical protein